MVFKRIEPHPSIARFVECYWIIQNENSQPVKQKIIPDGFTEFIFHFADPYCIQIGGEWENQARNLLAGQIDNYFFLENTGKADILGIKFMPAALTTLFGFNMHAYTNKVVDLDSTNESRLNKLTETVGNLTNHQDRIDFIDNYLKEISGPKDDLQDAPVDRAVNKILQNNGMVTVADLCEIAGVGERQLENLFKKYIGLSPKLFSRIIRFSYIFQLQENQTDNWAGLAYEAAYYDQSHFIRNFKRFTGESPAAYFFNEDNMANFFLKKK